MNGSGMFGVVNGAYYTCNEGRVEELSRRIAARNIPSSSLQPAFSMRPVSTKYAIMPILDQRAKATVPIIERPPYDIQKTFNPGTAQAPWSGFASHINDESRLRNQFFALQKCQQPVYIPSSDSDLYKVTVDNTAEQQPFPGLFEDQKFDKFDPNTVGVGQNLFNNCTRLQLWQKPRTPEP
jgi:hypothetical protein